MEVVIELIAELLAQLFVEGALDGLGRRTGNMLRSRRARQVLAYSLSLILALVVGVAWGAYVANTGRDALPRSVWVSLTLAAVCVVMAVIAHARDLPAEDQRTGWRAFRRPERWPAARWTSFAAMSAIMAIAIVIGFQAARPR